MRYSFFCQPTGTDVYHAINFHSPSIVGTTACGETVNTYNSRVITTNDIHDIHNICQKCMAIMVQ